MEMDGLWSNVSDERIRYTYNREEEVDEDHLVLLDYGARLYDPAIARWTSVDPMAEQRE